MAAKKFTELTFDEVYQNNDKDSMLELLSIDPIEWDLMDEKEQLETLGIPLGEWIKLEDYLYHNPLTPGLSSSGMKSIYHNTPAKYRALKDYPEKQNRDALVFGRAFHKYVLEPDEFHSEYFVYPGDVRKNSAAYKKYAEDAKGRELIKDTVFKDIEGMAESLKNHYNFLHLLRSGHNERAMFVWDDEYKCVLRVKVDADTNDKVLDLKTTTSANANDFSVTSAKFGYDLQNWLYLRICELGGDAKKMFGFVAVEKTRPYLVNGLVISPEDITYYTDKIAKKVLEQYSYCTETGDWFGYEMNFENKKKTPFQVISLPNWYKYNIEEEVGFEG